MDINTDIWVLDENKISQTYENKNDIQKPVGGLVEQVIKNEAEENNRTLTLIGKDIIKITSFPFVIGKSSKATYKIEGDTYISRKHCRITKLMGKFYIEDMDSLNGTFLNGDKVSGRTEINDGDEIKLADRKYVARWED